VKMIKPLVMNDKNIRAEELANKLFNKTITPEEEQELNSWYNQHLDDQVEIPYGFVASEEEHRVRILEAINVSIGKRKVVRLWPRVAVAVAAAIAVMVVGVWFFNSPRQSRLDVGNPALSMNDIKPGKNTATLTLANGKVITLSDAKNGVVIGDESIKYNDGAVIQGGDSDLRQDDSPSRYPEFISGSQLTASTPRGGTYQITLPDGSKAWLNAASSIRFPASFSGLVNRKVVLDGEAYFEVSKNKKQPFVVETKNQDVTVLGTHFNISSYADEGSVKTTLLEGSVKVSSGSRNDGVNAVVLKPNQQSILTNNKINVIPIDAQEAVAWKNGEFLFNNEPLGSIMNKVSRWYDVEIVYENSKMNQKRFWGSITRFTNVSDVLKMLELTGDVHFKIEGRAIIVKP